MSILRRITLILFGLLFITIITVALLVPQALISIVARIDPIPTPLRLVLVIAIDVIILALIYSLIRRRRVVNKGGLEVKSGRGNVLADVSTESARERVLKVIREVPAVVSAEAKLDAIDGKADIDMDVVVNGDHISVPDKHKEIDRALRQVVIKQLGLQLAGRPRVHIRLQGQDEVAPVVTPVLPVIEPPAPLPPPAPVTPVAAPVSPVPHDEASIGDAEVSSRFGLIGRRTEQVKAVPIEPPAPMIAPAPVVEPPAAVNTEPEFGGNWLADDPTPLPSEPAPAPIVEPEPSSGGFLRHWRIEEPETPPVTEPSVTVEDEAALSASVTDETDPIGQELESLDQASNSVETKGNVRVYNMPESDVADATLLTPFPVAPSAAVEPVEPSDEDSTLTPSSGLYDDIDDSPEPDSDETDTLSKFP